MRKFVQAASDAGWGTPAEPTYAPGSVISVTRGADTIEVEIGSGGIPRRVRRINPVIGRDEVIGQNYIRMDQLFKWLEEEEPREQDD